MVAAVDRFLPCPGGMNGHAQCRERRSIVVETLPVLFRERDDMSDAGWCSA